MSDNITAALENAQECFPVNDEKWPT